MEILFLFVLSMLAMESDDSIRLLYKHFLSKVTEKSLNAFYYACSYAKIDYFQFMNVTTRLAMQIIPESLHNESVFLCIDDTMIAKFGRTFEHVSKLFDHAAHNGSNYLNGHCFVSLINISYGAMKILPYKDKTFSKYKDTSVQEFRFALSQQINQQVIFSIFLENVETTIKSNTLVKTLKSVRLSFGYHR